MEYSKGLEEFLKYLKDCQTAYDISLTTQDETEEMTQDLLHQLELGDNSYHDQAHLARTLSDIRKQRREAKFTIQQLQPLIDWTTNNSITIKGLEQLLGKIRKEELKTTQLHYNNRTSIVEETLGRKERLS